MYITLDSYTNNLSRERFFVSYAVNGAMIAPGLRLGMPSLYPIDAPVHQPSPLNTRWEYIPESTTVGVL